MPSVNPSKPTKAKYGSSWLDWNIVRAKTGGSWQIGKKVWTKVNGSWTEVWNARPSLSAGSFIASSTTNLQFTGSVDPNNFTATASYRYREVGSGTWLNSGSTTKSGDGSQSFTVNATISDAYKYWEAQAVGSNDAGTADTPSTVYLDCRKGGWSYTDAYNSSTCDGCGTVTTRTYTKTGCPTYSEVVGNCGTWVSFTGSNYPYGSVLAVSGGTYSYVYASIYGFYYSDSAGNGIYNPVCGGLAAPGDVQYCGSSYRVAGSDTCVYPTCC